MRLIVFYCLSCITFLIARENPFAPINSSENVGKATQIQEQKKDFSQVQTQLPSTARILKKLELHYQNLDGSIESMSVDIDEKIDWHDHLLLKTVGKTKPKVDKNRAVQAVQKPIQETIKEYDFRGILQFSVLGNTIFIKTKDIKARDFLINKPYKIVIDFQREINFFTKSINVSEKKVDSVTFGKHDGYYRMVIALDGQYLYSLEKTNEGYKITLR